MNLPTDQEILALHHQYAPHQAAFDIVWNHCQIISDIASSLIMSNDLKLDGRLVHAAAMLHDLGYYSLFDESGYAARSLVITHGVAGAALLRREHLDEAICRIAERHTGVGLTRAAIIAEKLPLPARNLVAETPAERLVMYSDKFHTKAITPDQSHETLGWFNRPDSYLKHTARFGESNARIWRALISTYGVPNLETLARKYHEPLK